MFYLYNLYTILISQIAGFFTTTTGRGWTLNFQGSPINASAHSNYNTVILQGKKKPDKVTPNPVSPFPPPRSPG